MESFASFFCSWLIFRLSQSQASYCAGSLSTTSFSVAMRFPPIACVAENKTRRAGRKATGELERVEQLSFVVKDDGVQ